jgi:hypothetical protein
MLKNEREKMLSGSKFEVKRNGLEKFQKKYLILLAAMP